MSESKTSRRRLSAHDRQLAALDLRKAGVSFPAISRQLGYSGPAGAYKAVLAALRATQQEPADEVRQLAVERLDRLLFAVWQRALDPTDPAQLDCLDRVLKIELRRAKLLGLDTVDRVDMEGRLRLLARALGFSESEEAAAVVEAERYLREGQGRRATTL